MKGKNVKLERIAHHHPEAAHRQAASAELAARSRRSDRTCQEDEGPGVERTRPTTAAARPTPHHAEPTRTQPPAPKLGASDTEGARTAPPAKKPTLTKPPAPKRGTSASDTGAPRAAPKTTAAAKTTAEPPSTPSAGAATSATAGTAATAATASSDSATKAKTPIVFKAASHIITGTHEPARGYDTQCGFVWKTPDNTWSAGTIEPSDDVATTSTNYRTRAEAASALTSAGR